MFLFCLFFVFEKGLDTSDNNFVCETTSCEIKNLIPICVSNSLPLFYCHCFYYYYNYHCYNIVFRHSPLITAFGQWMRMTRDMQVTAFPGSYPILFQHQSYSVLFS